MLSLLTLLEFYQHLETPLLFSPVTDLIPNEANQHPQDTLCNYIRQNRQFHFLDLMDLGFEIQKTNFGIKICILEIQCVPIFMQNEQIWLFWPKFAQNFAQKIGFWFEIQQTNVEIRISILKIPCVPISRQNEQLYLFCQNLPKGNLELEIHKTSVAIRISILEIPIVPIFR